MTDQNIMVQRKDFHENSTLDLPKNAHGSGSARKGMKFLPIVFNIRKKMQYAVFCG